MAVDLVNQRQILVTFGVLDLIDADCLNGTEGAMLEAEGNKVFHRIADVIPGSVEGFGRFFPGESPRPAAQKEHVGPW